MKKILFALLLLAVPAFNAYSQPVEIPSGSICLVCGMKVDAKSPFSAEATDKDGKLLAFCDIGDLLYHLGREKEAAGGKAYIRDYNSGKWIDALTASYVKSDKFMTPMGWGIAGFEKKEDALKSGDVLTFTEAMAMTKSPMKKKMGH